MELQSFALHFCTHMDVLCLQTMKEMPLYGMSLMASRSRQNLRSDPQVSMSARDFLKSRSTLRPSVFHCLHTREQVIKVSTGRFIKIWRNVWRRTKMVFLKCMKLVSWATYNTNIYFLRTSETFIGFFPSTSFTLPGDI